MRRGYLRVPQMPGKGAYEILTDGPIAIWHFLANREYRGRKRYAFQIYREAVPMCFLTKKHLSYVVMQSDIPVFIPKGTHVIVEGSNVKLYLGANCEVRARHNKRITASMSSSFSIPNDNIIVLFCADMRDFGDTMKVVVTSGMDVYCAGGNYINLRSADTVIVSM
uniref:C1q domain-containing protein n=1 Tax=Ascaris lumbricoides TaxID=6252 RepID=A0A0M3HWW0_ASCLU